MLIVDDKRRYVDANRAACLLLRLSRERVLELRVDDLTPAEDRADMEALWSELLRMGTQSGPFELATPDGMRISVDYSATAHVAPGRHLGVLSLPMIDPSSVRPILEDPEQLEPHAPLSDRVVRRPRPQRVCRAATRPARRPSAGSRTPRPGVRR